MSKRTKILVTGGAGFIGSEFVRQAAAKEQNLVVVDKLTYAGDQRRLKEIKGHYTFYKVDIANLKNLDAPFRKERPAVVVHFAAETHVDRSIQDAKPFIQTNVIGTQNLIDLSRQYNVKKFLHISTDEVYGESQNGRFRETSPLKPNNPYSATKAAAEALIKAAIRTHQFPAVIVRPSNNYGPWQYPEKFIPVVISRALRHQKIPVYGKGQHIREWLHVSDCAAAIHLILAKGKAGETYNIGSHHEQPNLKTAKDILNCLGKPQHLIQFVQDRPGHDFRYSVDYSKLRRLGWWPKVPLEQGIQETVNWYSSHPSWRNLGTVPN